jgi:hypothetical protein
MAITFEQKQGISKSVIAAGLIVVLLAAIGFFVWKVYWQEAEQELEVGSSQIQLEYRVLNDERIISMELFPEIPAANEAGIGKKNPFAESEATTTIELVEGEAVSKNTGNLPTRGE